MGTYLREGTIQEVRLTRGFTVFTFAVFGLTSVFEIIVSSLCICDVVQWFNSVCGKNVIRNSDLIGWILEYPC